MKLDKVHFRYTCVLSFTQFKVHITYGPKYVCSYLTSLLR